MTTLVILFLMTGSVVLPVKALVMNLLTLSAAFGLLVLIFQDGHLEGLLGFTSQGALESSQPVLLFAVAFGLSTDYGVFLLTRIKEAHDKGASNEEAVALGLERTGRIVTFAALLFVIAIGAFATSQIIFIKQLGVGTALAVLIDATIVRALLVPVADAAAGRPQLVGAAAAGAAAPADRAVGDGAGVTNRFDADTALEGADGRWRAEVKEHWFVQRGPNGGLVAALATRALADLAGPEQSPRSLSLHYLAPPEAGELEVRAAVERAGRTTTFASIRVLQGGTTVAYGLGACSAWREGQPSWDVLERPDVPPPGEIAQPRHRRRVPVPRQLRDAPARGPAQRRVDAHRRAARRPTRCCSPRSPTPGSRPPSRTWSEPNFVPTIDLTIHWRAAPGVPAGDHPWVLGLFTTRLGAGGTWEEDGELWSEDGVLLAHSRQLAIVSNPR